MTRPFGGALLNGFVCHGGRVIGYCLIRFVGPSPAGSAARGTASLQLITPGGCSLLTAVPS